MPPAFASLRPRRNREQNAKMATHKMDEQKASSWMSSELNAGAMPSATAMYLVAKGARKYPTTTNTPHSQGFPPRPRANETMAVVAATSKIIAKMGHLPD
jgi:hypothetical protein